MRRHDGQNRLGPISSTAVESDGTRPIFDVEWERRGLLGAGKMDATAQPRCNQWAHIDLNLSPVSDTRSMADRHEQRVASESSRWLRRGTSDGLRSRKLERERQKNQRESPLSLPAGLARPTKIFDACPSGREYRFRRMLFTWKRYAVQNAIRLRF